jgi:(1->4)-alpha-D-glucan 1-alpha-D-glucosylmutase
MRIPAATYRLQFNRHFTYQHAQAIVPYLHSLGISHIYASPAFQARIGSEHGYDVADPTRLNAEVGTRRDFDRLARALHAHGMDLLLDIVPNHMAASAENPWWNDVLENGRKSRYAHFYDIDWDATPADPTLAGRVLLPILGDSYGKVLQRGELHLRLGPDGFFVDYHGNCIPVAPDTYREILDLCHLGASPTLRRELHRLAQGLAGLNTSARDSKVARIKRDIWRLYQSPGKFRPCFRRALAEFEASGKNPSAIHRLDSLLSKQHYRLSYWRTAQEEINYRRFFDINDLVSLRVELPDVFHARHALIAQLIRAGAIGALRVDHVDGLRDPLEYLRRARTDLRKKNRGDVYTVVEKILCGAETLPLSWPVEGTTGYEFLNAANFLFTSGPGYAQLERLHQKLTGDTESFEAVWRSRKKLVMDRLFRAETRALSRRLIKLAALDRQARDIPRDDLRAALKDFTACLPVYRTYIPSHTTPANAISSSDRRLLLETLRHAAQTSPALSRPPVRAFFTRLFTARLDAPSPSWHRAWLEFMLRWQVFTGPVMAKGFEDTSFYTHVPLISLNDVGSDVSRAPHLFGSAPFHQFIRTRAAHWPHSLNATSTHDTKRSEDVRARIAVLSEIPRQYASALSRWRSINSTHLASGKAEVAPSPREESIIYQSLIGAWPLQPTASNLKNLAERMRDFVIKAARESKESSSWLNPNQTHESRLQQFVSDILNPRKSRRFLSDFSRFHVRHIAIPGAINSLSQSLLKITAPGAPDIYQGNDLWDFSLTDPDNRRSVDFHSRARLLRALHRELEPALPASRLTLCAALTQNWPDSRIKLFLTLLALQFRNAHSELFAHGDYTPLRATGPHADNILAFTRSYRGHTILVALPRLVSRFADAHSAALVSRAFNSTRLLLPRRAPSRWLNIFTLESFPVSSTHSLLLSPLFLHLPFALLTSAP